MATPDLKIDNTKLMSYLMIAQNQRKRELKTMEERYGDGAVTDAIREDVTELVNAINILAKDKTLNK